MGCSCLGSNIFSSGAGKVVAVDGEAVPVHFAVDGDNNTFHDLKAIVTSVGLQSQGGFQFMHALREFIYLYVFTERVGEIVINGLAFPETCNFGPQGAQDDDSRCIHGQSGLERVQTWYECHRVTTRAAPISISFGAAVSYEAFLVACKIDIANPETGIAQFTMRFNFVPVISDSDDFCFPLDEDCLWPPCEPDLPMFRHVDDLEEEND
jgi:hypothetical protein